MEKLVYSTTEAAQALGIGRTKLYQLIERGVIRVIKIDSRTLIRPEELRRYLDSLSVPDEPVALPSYNPRTARSR